MEKEIFEKTAQTFMVVLLNETPYPFVVPKIKHVKINGKEHIAFFLSDSNVELALSTDSRIYGISILSEEEKILRFFGSGLVNRDEKILALFGKSTESGFVVLLKIENLKEGSLR